MNKKGVCFAHSHMTFAEYGFYSHLREVSNKNNFEYVFDDRTLASRFAQEYGVSKDSANRLRNSLANKGFVEWMGPQLRSGGRFVQRRGRILSHAEWAKKHPGKCERRVGEASTSLTSTTGTSLSSDTGTSLKLGDDQSQTLVLPVSPARHSIYTNTKPYKTNFTEGAGNVDSEEKESSDDWRSTERVLGPYGTPVAPVRQVTTEVPPPAPAPQQDVNVSGTPYGVLELTDQVIGMLGQLPDAAGLEVWAKVIDTLERQWGDENVLKVTTHLASFGADSAQKATPESFGRTFEVSLKVAKENR